MFIGRYYHTIEENGRVSLPKRFREAGDDWVVTRGLDGGLFVFLNNQFETEIAKFAEFSFTKQANRDLVRLFTNDAQALQVDAQGRILIPEYLRATAQLAKEVVIIGSYKRIEIWDVKSYHDYSDRLASQAEAIAERAEL